MKNLKKIVKAIVPIIARLIPLKKQIVFSNFYGKLPGDNPYYIWQWAEKHKIQSIWLVNDLKSAREEYAEYSFTKFVKYRGIRALMALSTSQIWVDNVRKPWIPLKRGNQLYIQTWHGEPLKHIEADAISSLDNFYLQWAKNDSKALDYVISGSDLSVNAFLKAFWLENGKEKILKIGEPRWDFFNNLETIDFSPINSTLGLNSDDKIILYMPTFRDSKGNNNAIKLNFDELIALFDSNYKLILRLHPNISHTYLNTNNPRIINASKFGNPQDLIARSEVVITDYSSSMFDAMIANKKVILLAKDLDQYLNNNRKLYLEYKELPFPTFYSEDELQSFIVNQFNDNGMFNYNGFIQQYGFIKEYNATEKIGKIILNKLNNTGKKKCI
ncbi:CDP-glycerol glycerophosphotransferase family protein [Leuconostoc citreum]|uniref:CDP-glycerol glycerophosphotransferase family protein n=1 Tax=Leuconostoc citreum TaxID=33964 RepID=UPI00211B25F6|nr:CDP-glycerol glycerophosphotransferase family protein [Leuconostoc citreum]MCQ6659449.1 CDP-glycerol glycerophosphotransferase family protein [Leuconostoc citreum]